MGTQHDIPNVDRRSILVMAAACNTRFGSEWSMGWSFVKEAARERQVTLLTAGPLDDSDLAALDELGVEVDHLPLWFPAWDRLSKYSVIRMFDFRLANLMWGWRARRRLATAYRDRPFDAVHHSTMSTVWRPSPLRALGRGYTVGPVTGGMTVPPAWRCLLSGSARRADRVQQLVVRACTVLGPATRRTYRRATRVLSSSETTDALVRRAGASDVVPYPAITLTEDVVATIRSVEPASKPADEVWMVSSGRALEWKGYGVAFQTLAVARRTHPKLRYICTVTGSDFDKLSELATEFGVDDIVRILPGLQRDEAFAYVRQADVFLYPSLRDQPGVVLLEAHAAGVPVVCLCGVVRGMEDGCPRPVPTDLPGRDVPAALAAIVTSVLDDPEGTRAMVDRATRLLDRQLLATWSAQLIELIDPGSATPVLASVSVLVDGQA